MNCFVTRQSDGSYMLTEQEPVIAEVHGAGVSGREGRMAMAIKGAEWAYRRHVRRRV